MIQLSFDNGTVESPTIVLSQRDYTHLGQISNVSGFNSVENMNAPNELSFTIYKELNGHEEILWDDIYDLRLIWVKELNEYFEINVSKNDSSGLMKQITAKSLCESELSQVNLHNIEINTEADIERDNYKPTVFYCSEDEKDKKDCLLDRILDKAPAYTIKHVDDNLSNLQRTFSISDTSIYDWLIGECSETFNCLFIFDSTDRSISVYDLFTVCEECGYRGNFNDICPECGSVNLYTYGEDTTILCSTENLTNEIVYETDIDSAKNCFKLEAGDDNMTAAVININPNGSSYIYNFSDESLRDMPVALQNKITSYNDLYREYRKTKTYTTPTLPTRTFDFNRDEDPVPVNFNDLVDRYEDWFYEDHDEEKELIRIPTLFVGYPTLMTYIYELYELKSYLQSSMIPTVHTDGGISASTEADRIRKNYYGFEGLDGLIDEDGIHHTISVTKFTEHTSVATVNSAITNYVKVLIKSGYVKIKVVDVEYADGSSTWSGKFEITNYSDEDDVVVTPTYTFTIGDDYENYMRQKIAKYIARSTSEEADALYNTLKPSVPIEDFTNAIKHYSANRLASFRDAIDAALTVMQEAGCAAPSSSSSQEQAIYEEFYLVYYDKYVASCNEFDLRSHEIDVCEDTLTTLLSFKASIQEELNFKNYIDRDNPGYYNLLTTYIREDTYNNSNYISDGLTNDELFEKAQEFMDAAEKELIKSSFYQHSLSANLFNLLTIKEFELIKDKFRIGNWIRVKVDDDIYRLRLISYSINFDDLTTINTEFSDVTKTANGLNDVQSILKQASGIATSYSAVTKQAEAGRDANDSLDKVVSDGLNAALTNVKNNDSEEITITSGGIIGRSYDDIDDTYSDKQVRITHNIITFTEDNWKTVSTALGEITYERPDGEGGSETVTSYGLIAKAVVSGYIYGTDIVAGTIQNMAGSNVINMNVSGSSAVDKFIHTTNFDVYGDGRMVCNNATITGKITSTSGNIGGFNITNTSLSKYSGEPFTDYGGTTWAGDKWFAIGSNDYAIKVLTALDSTDHPGYKSWGNRITVDWTGKLFASNVELTGAIHATSGDFGSGVDKVKIGTGCIYSGNKISIDTNQSGFYIGNDGISCGATDSSNRSKFKVTNTGTLYASDANISGEITSSTIKGSSLFEMTANNSPYDTTLTWGGTTWADSLTVVVNQNTEASLGVAHKTDKFMYAVYMHYNDIRWYDNNPNPRYAQFGAPVESDIRLKKNIHAADKSIIRKLFKNINFISFDYIKEDLGSACHGMIAQEVDALMDELNFDKTQYIGKNKDGYYYLLYSNFNRLNLIATQDLYDQIDKQQKEIELLKQQLLEKLS